MALAFYTFFTYRILCATHKSASAAVDTAKTAHDQLVASSRPWIEVSEVILKNQVVNGGDYPTMTLTSDVIVKNRGGSPARVYIEVDSKVGAEWGHRWKAETCKTAGLTTVDQASKVVFPFREGDKEGTDMGPHGAPPMIIEGAKWLVICVAYEGVTGGMYHAEVLYRAVLKNSEHPILVLTPVPHYPIDHFNYEGSKYY